MAVLSHRCFILKFLDSFFCHKEEDEKIREYILVVATLIAAVTFQAGVNPPGGVWQEGDKAGRAIYASDETAFFVFMTCNTLALSWSILVIMSLTWRSRFFPEVAIATVLMAITYGASIFAITPKDTKKMKFRYILSIAAFPAQVRVAVLIGKHVKNKLSCRRT